MTRSGGTAGQASSGTRAVPVGLLNKVFNVLAENALRGTASFSGLRPKTGDDSVAPGLQKRLLAIKIVGSVPPSLDCPLRAAQEGAIVQSSVPFRRKRS